MTLLKIDRLNGQTVASFPVPSDAYLAETDRLSRLVECHDWLLRNMLEAGREVATAGCLYKLAPS